MTMRHAIMLSAAAALLLAAAVGCGTNGEKQGASVADIAPASDTTVAGEVTVFVPCGIAGPYGEIKKLFEERHPGVKVAQELANIDVQTKLILDGKGTPDVWLSLGDREMNLVLDEDLVDGEPVTYAINSIAMIVAKNNPCDIEDLRDLAKADVKTLAMPTEANSSGYYMRQALEQAGVWESVQPKLWVTDQPALVKSQLASGKADAGVVYYPCTRETRIIGGEPEELKGKVQLLGKLPTELSGPIPAQAAVIKGSPNPEAGHAFLQFLLTEEVQDIWEKWAFDRAVPSASGPKVTLYLYCGAGIRPFMDDAVDAFKAVRPDVRIDVGYAGSGCLLSQLMFARRGDLYMPGEDFYLDQAKERGFIVADKLIGHFEPVLLVQKGNPKAITSVQDLTRPGLKVGIGEPEAAAVGRAAEELLRKAGLLDAVQPNVVLRAGNVPELGNAVKLRSLDVAIVWNVTAAQVADSCDEIRIPEELARPIPVPMGILTFSAHRPEARAFLDFCAGAQGQKIVQASGMKPAAPEALAVR